MAKKIKDKICPICENSFKPIYSTLQQTCSAICAIKYNSEKEVKKRFEQIKVDLGATKELEKAARVIFQKWIRERDKDFPCISCNRTQTMQWDAGHYFSAERFSGLIFEEDNVHKQCSECNGSKMHGNLEFYKLGLVKRYGTDFVEQLESIADSNRVYKYQRSELIDIANKYKLKLKNLIKANSQL